MNKKLGDCTCNDYRNCEDCPLAVINCLEWVEVEETLFDRLERWYEEFDDVEIYNIVKARLDKVVE